MRYLFSEEGASRLREVLNLDTLCVFDFDGTLVPIVEHPDQVSVSHEILERLEILCRLTQVAILTGRSVNDVRAHLGFEPAYVIGNHGLEGLPGVQTDVAHQESICAAWKEALSAYLDSLNDEAAGIWIEDKRLSLSVHYRGARDRHEAIARLSGMFAQLEPPPRIIAGKLLFNLLPHGAGDKGRAMEHLMRISGAAGAIYVGDDVTDEDVFRLKRRDVVSVRVEFFSESAAEFFLADAGDIPRLLDMLLARIGGLRWKAGELRTVDA